MKVKVKDIVANPFRRMKEYPIDKGKVESLKQSIRDTTFWDNLLARKKGDKYELAYGHHRWMALKELKVKEVDIPVRDLSDEDMLRIMANENMDDWSLGPKVLMETVRAAYDFLQKIVDRHDTFESFKKDPDAAVFGIKNGNAFSTIKANGVGIGTIQGFLGKQWSRTAILTGLAVVKSDPEKVDKKAIASMRSTKKVEAFTKAVRRYNVPKSEQKVMIKEINRKDTPAGDINSFVRRKMNASGRQPKSKLEKLRGSFESVEKDTLALANKVRRFNAECAFAGVQVGGLSAIFAMDSVRKLVGQLKLLVSRLDSASAAENLKIGGRE